MSGLLRSRKFWLAVIGVAETIVLEALGVPMEIWLAIDALLVALIGAIAIEDAGAKRGGSIPPV